MATIDADSHVIETDATWVHMDGADAKHRPLAVDSRTDPPREFWMIDGKLREDAATSGATPLGRRRS